MLYCDGGSVTHVLNLVLAMDDTTRAIQGPPDAGKTYTGSHVIVGLVKAGKRVGVSSNSHKAIDNLSVDIGKVARQQGVRLRGMKRVNGRKVGTEFEGDMLTNVEDNRELIANIGTACCRVAAGTVWLFADDEFLGTTFRMNPDVCRFISQAVDDSRLQSAPSTSGQLWF